MEGSTPSPSNKKEIEVCYVVVIRPTFVKQEYKKVDLYSKEHSECFRSYFEECSKNYSAYLDYYFTREGGVLNGFRFTNA